MQRSLCPGARGKKKKKFSKFLKRFWKCSNDDSLWILFAPSVQEQPIITIPIKFILTLWFSQYFSFLNRTFANRKGAQNFIYFSRISLSLTKYIYIYIYNYFIFLGFARVVLPPDFTGVWGFFLLYETASIMTAIRAPRSINSAACKSKEGAKRC